MYNGWYIQFDAIKWIAIIIQEIDCKQEPFSDNSRLCL